MRGATASRPLEVLLVEDNPGDARLTTEAMREGRVRTNLCHVADGAEALAFLRREGAYGSAPRPDIILLDLNLPKKDGREVLREVKADPALRRIPVVVLTTSSAEQDVLRSYDLHANCYINKPVDFDDFLRVVRAVENFWLATAELPSEVDA